MSEVLEVKLVEYLQKTESFVISEAPEFVRQAINYYFYEYLLTLIFCLFIVLCTSLFLFNVKKLYDFLTIKNYWGDTDASVVCIAASIISSVGLFISSIQACIVTLLLIKICVAPNLYLLEKLVQ